MCSEVNIDIPGKYDFKIKQTSDSGKDFFVNGNAILLSEDDVVLNVEGKRMINVSKADHIRNMFSLSLYTDICRCKE